MNLLINLNHCSEKAANEITKDLLEAGIICGWSISKDNILAKDFTLNIQEPITNEELIQLGILIGYIQATVK